MDVDTESDEDIMAINEFCSLFILQEARFEIFQSKKIQYIL